LLRDEMQKTNAWGKDGKTSFVTINYLEILVNIEKVMLEKVNQLCGLKMTSFHEHFYHVE
jgi:hypothetical protein